MAGGLDAASFGDTPTTAIAGATPDLAQQAAQIQAAISKLQPQSPANDPMLWLQFAAGMGAPTKSGSFFEGLGNASKNVSDYAQANRAQGIQGLAAQAQMLPMLNQIMLADKAAKARAATLGLAFSDQSPNAAPGGLTTTQTPTPAQSGIGGLSAVAAPSSPPTQSPAGGIQIPPGLTRAFAMANPDAAEALIMEYNKKLMMSGTEAPKIETAYDPATGRESKMQYIPGKGFVSFGGVKAPEVGTGFEYKNGQAAILPGFIQGKSALAGAEAGATAGAQKAAELQYTAPLTEARARAEAAAINAPVMVDGKVMTRGEAKTYLEGKGRNEADLRMVNVGGDIVPTMQAKDTAKDQAKKAQSAKSVMDILNEIEPMKKDEATGNMIPDLSKSILEKATSSNIGAMADVAARQFGLSPESANSAAQLKVLGNALMMNMPRMEGPQSDADVRMYKEAAGNLADPGTPKGQKRASIAVIRKLNEKYLPNQSGFTIRPVEGK